MVDLIAGFVNCVNKNVMSFKMPKSSIGVSLPEFDVHS